jgi:hypothetical protein
MGLLQEWLPEYTWPKLKASEGEKQRFRGLGDDLQSDNDEWCESFDVKIAPLPSDYEQTFSPLDFQSLCISSSDFIDDLNLPEVDTYNTQSAIAHLRQPMEYEHC